MGFTREQYDALPARIKPESVTIAQPHSAPQPVQQVSSTVKQAGFAVSQSKDEAKLNKTERRYLATLRTNPNVKWIGIQSLTFKLGDDLRFTPDFCYLIDGKLICVDTKGGFIREDSTIKIKVAARMFPWAEFVVEQWKDNAWQTKEIKG